MEGEGRTRKKRLLTSKKNTISPSKKPQVHREENEEGREVLDDLLKMIRRTVRGRKHSDLAVTRKNGSKEEQKKMGRLIPGQHKERPSFRSGTKATQKTAKNPLGNCSATARRENAGWRGE